MRIYIFPQTTVLIILSRQIKLLAVSFSLLQNNTYLSIHKYLSYPIFIKDEKSKVRQTTTKEKILREKRNPARKKREKTSILYHVHKHLLRIDVGRNFVCK
uniref:Uncharacterized protein n=1 Tax=Cacopsylla melanoneura TaxID=428564 RepID=A0A8D8YKE0_9HEMI